MLDAPRQDWNAYQLLVGEQDRRLARNLTFADRFARYEDLFELVCQHPRPVDQQARLEKRRWQEKLSIRKRQLAAYGLK